VSALGLRFFSFTAKNPTASSLTKNLYRGYLIPVLVKAIQELTARVQQLSAEVQALKLNK
jgi:hypothetical protein